MNDPIYLLHARSGLDHRAAVVMAWIGLALFAITALVAEHEHAWKSAIVGGLTGAALMGSAITYVKARLWERVAVERQTGGQ